MKSNLTKPGKTFLVLFSVAFGVFMLTTNFTGNLTGAAANPLIPPPSDGAKLYAAACAKCHGSDGQANTPKGKQTNAVDLTSDDWEPDDARDTRIISKGKGRMPGFKRTLKPDEIKSIVTYIRNFK